MKDAGAVLMNERSLSYDCRRMLRKSLRHLLRVNEPDYSGRKKRTLLLYLLLLNLNHLQTLVGQCLK